MKVAIVGSREFPHQHWVEYYVRHCIPQDSTLISGDAPGVDRWAETAARQFRPDLKLEIYPAEWNRFGNQAGVIRNQKMVERADIVVAFWAKQSKGTGHTIRLAKKARKPLLIVRPDGSKQHLNGFEELKR